ncbi:MAG: hypothetical protein A2521_15435 [Deltaproteobacteria bacterium RIFOXYD12_FULL_57_12]|nr:MAG: hypothetical protein A2521_15435 [Deltaproteobacteria bacterium RIFOXYD12_FULL_57_12]
MSDIPTHHRIYGTTIDFLSGETVVDTDDERLRQELARFLVEDKNYEKTDLAARLTIETLFAGQFVVSTIDFVLTVQGKKFMIIRYGPGSLVTRERPAIAAARVLEPAYQIPRAVVTNARDAELLDTRSGKVLATGLACLPDRSQAIQLVDSLTFAPITDEKCRERELRILNAFDVEVCCVGGPCALPGAPEG